MIIKTAEYVTSAVDTNGFINDGLSQICFVGRSNAGKSSLINLLTNNKSLARVSGTPGRTRMINYFIINKDEFYLTDLPGYGYQKGSKQDAQKWAQVLSAYLNFEPNIKQVFVLMDIRHKPSDKDIEMLNYLYHYQLPFTIVATKADKLSRAQRDRALKVIAGETKVGVDNIIPVSNIDGYNKDKILKRIGEVLEH